MHSAFLFDCTIWKYVWNILTESINTARFSKETKTIIKCIVDLPWATLSVSTFREKWLKDELDSKVSYIQFVSLSFIDEQAEGCLVMCYTNINNNIEASLTVP